ncbi:hypothetical protein [Microbacterium xylanilyticum]
MLEHAPVDLDAVLGALGISPLRVGLIRVTLQRGSVSLPELVEELGVSRTTLIAHKDALVEAGILIERRDPSMAGARSGFNRFVYRVDEKALRAHLEQLRNSLLP